MESCYLLADPPPTHWSRKNFPILVCSPRLEQVQRCIQDNNSSSNLSALKGVEVLLLIASFSGLAVLEPCSCCRGEPFRYCGMQCRHFLVGDFPQPQQQNPKKKDYSTTLDMSLCALDTDDYIYYSEHVPLHRDWHSGWKWEETSQKTIIEKSLTEIGRLHHSRGSSDGIGYLACSSKGFYSSWLDMEWNDMQNNNWQITCRRSPKKSGMVHYYLYFSKTLLGSPSKITAMHTSGWSGPHPHGRKVPDAEIQAFRDLELKTVSVKRDTHRFRLCPSACLPVVKAVLAQGLKIGVQDIP
ncbi:expressed unknown protein [Seminavis robusta]|uniref:Uncharacterized protein n=1 Tax=Seminavis robusta TaxID=568900 RepID=A0A9N8F3D7_9STRA|nr:expressed unknown protein [Seminavis robusta]|eukprot:Sro4447_g354030.1 n/a (298) ;mRNA; f:556-1449